MKKIALFLLAIIGSMSVMGQNCDYYMPFQLNKGMQYQSFSAKDKLTGSNEVIVKKIDNEDGFLVATMMNRAMDQKGKLVNEGEYTVKCSGSTIMVDMKSMVNPQSMAGFEGMDVVIEGADMELPNNLVVGSTLPDARMKMSVMNNGITITEMIIEITARKVESKETISVPAGTFECYKITYDTYAETKTMGIPIRVKGKSVEYFSKGIGSVKTETLDEKGRSQGYTVLSKIL